MKPSRALLTLATVSMAACLDGSVGLELAGGPPAWSSGFAHTYVFDGTLAGEAVVDGATNREEERVGPVTLLQEVVSTRHAAQGEPVYLVAADAKDAPAARSPQGQPMPGTGPAGPQLLAVRARDLAAASAGIGSDGKLQVQPLPSTTWLRFPLRQGDTWEARSDGFTTFFTFNAARLDVQFQATARVVGRSTVDTPMGPVDTVLVEQTYAPTNLGDWPARVREQAEQVGATVTKLEIKAEALHRIHYSPDYATEALIEFSGHTRQRVAGTGSNGKPFDVTVDLTAAFTRSLVGARLVPGLELDLPTIEDVLEGKIPLQDATGGVHKPGSYQLRIEADRASSNAAKKEQAFFKAKLEGAQALPAGHALSWRIASIDGKEVAAGSGESLAHRFEQPGLYRVEVTSRDSAGAIVAADGTPFAANYEDTKTAACPPVAVSGLPGPCAAVPVPVRPGFRALTVEGRPASVLAPLAEGRLVLKDAAGKVVQEVQGPGTLKIQLDGTVNATAATDRDWSLQWIPERSVAETLEHRLDVRFGEAAADPGGGAPGTSWSRGAGSWPAVGGAGFSFA